MIRSSKLSLKYLNKQKREFLFKFVDEYKRCLEIVIDFLWTSKIEVDEKILDVANGFYECPMFVKDVPEIDTWLTGRILSCIKTQASGMVRSVLNRRMKEEDLLSWKISKGKKDEKLQKRMELPPTKPSINEVNCELNSLNVSIQKSKAKTFDYWLELFSYTKEVKNKKIYLPLKSHSRLEKWNEEGKLLNGVSIGKKHVSFRFDVTTPEIRKNGEITSVDQGAVDMLTVRGGWKPIFEESHWMSDWTMLKVLKKLSNCKKGSKGFQRAIELRKNFTHAYLNKFREYIKEQNITEVKLENIENIKYGRRSSRVLSHWSNPLIRDAIKKVCEEEGVLLTLVPNPFNSQRCFKCGWTQKSNRKGKMFKCKHCGHEDDADENATENIYINFSLPKVSKWLIYSMLNISGFFWIQEGFYYANQEPIVPDPHETLD